MAVISAAAQNAARTAVVTSGEAYSFQTLLHGAYAVARGLERAQLKRTGKWGPRAGLYFRPGIEYVAATWGTWLAGGIVVPLCLSHTQREVGHILRDADVSLVLTHEDLKPSLQSFARTTVQSLRFEQSAVSPPFLPSAEDGALLLYTSGTTGKPKGVLHTHRSLDAQTGSLSTAWEIRRDDVALHALPLHHIHGVVNALYTPHRNGACVRLAPKFSPDALWTAFKEGGVSVFMGVPTMYAHLLAWYKERSPQEQSQLSRGAAHLRLFVSGSAACPEPLMREWKEATEHWLLERYGMTEIGMALSNPLKGERRPGFVGRPLPGVSCRIRPISDSIGELLVKGETLFSEYWNMADATAEAFDGNGYFKTGDVVRQDGHPPAFKILGRASVDIINSGGYTLSALEIESVVLEHPAVLECSVVGLPDPVYGQIVAAVVRTEGLSEEDLQSFCRDRLAKYKLPRRVVRVREIPRNAMGKVNKKELATLVLQNRKPAAVG